MNLALILASAAAVQATDAVPPFPDQPELYRVLFADIHHTLLWGNAETGINRTWTQGYDVHISELNCEQEGRSAVCRFRLTRTPDGTPRDRHAGTGRYTLGCRAELRFAPGPDRAPVAWRVRQAPGPSGTPPRSTMRCSRDRNVRG